MCYRVILLIFFMPLALYARALDGLVVDSLGMPVANVNLMHVHTNRGCASDLQGRFRFESWPVNGDSLHVSCLGYQGKTLFVRPDAPLRITLTPVSFVLEDLRLKAHRHKEQRVTRLSLSEVDLQQEIGLTLAETLEQEPGVSRRSMGPAPARPVLRGLSGDRLQLLEDGLPTGDLSATSADHAVSIEPLAAHGVVLLRGADALLYSPAMGGVVDVDRNLRADPAKSELSAGLYFDSASMGKAVNLRAEHGIGRLGIVADGSLRDTGDLRTPGGRLDNSSLESSTGGLALALGDDDLGADLGFSAYISEYGIPGGFTGGHPNGVSIRMQQRSLRAGWRESGHLPIVSRLDYNLALVRYYHAEYESNGQLGIDFGVLSVLQELDLHLCDTEGTCGSRLRASAEFRDFATGGLSHAPDTDEWRLGLAWLQEFLAGDHRIRTAFRADYSHIAPDEERVSSVVGHIRTRSFQGFSGVVEWHAPELSFADAEWSAGLGLQYSTRAPTSLELFSGGPHLAAYSYEIGNPESNNERALGLELPLRVTRSGMSAELNLFHTWYQDYLFPSFTGQLSARRADLYEYRIMSRDARIGGAEFSCQGEWSFWELEGTLSYVRGSLKDGEPLPEMPPLSGLLGLHHNQGSWRFGVETWAAMPQERLYKAEDPDAERETRTAGWLRVDADLAWTLPLGSSVQRIQLRAENLLDLEYRQHLSRIRSVMPEAGRTLRLVWKVWL